MLENSLQSSVWQIMLIQTSLHIHIDKMKRKKKQKKEKKQNIIPYFITAVKNISNKLVS